MPCSGCRVIARLMRERDEARAMLASANINMTNTAAAAAAVNRNHRCVVTFPLGYL